LDQIAWWILSVARKSRRTVHTRRASTVLLELRLNKDYASPRGYVILRVEAGQGTVPSMWPRAVRDVEWHYTKARNLEIIISRAYGTITVSSNYSLLLDGWERSYPDTTGRAGVYQRWRNDFCSFLDMRGASWTMLLTVVQEIFQGAVSPVLNTRKATAEIHIFSARWDWAMCNGMSADPTTRKTFELQAIMLATAEAGLTLPSRVLSHIGHARILTFLLDNIGCLFIASCHLQIRSHENMHF